MEVGVGKHREGGGAVAGVDIGGTKIAIGLVEKDGRVVLREEMPIHVERGPAYACERIVETLRKQVAARGAGLAGVGIGCTGPVDPVSGELGDVNTLPGWKHWNPVQELSAALGVSVAMENDADAAVLGEFYCGTTDAVSSLLCITVGTGIGAGIVLDRAIYRGAKGAHPELGHHIVEPDGPACSCGARGCWEALASGPAMEAWYLEQSGLPGSVPAKDICALARAGDDLALRAVEREARYLGLGLSNIVSIFMPQAIVLGGSVMRSADLFLPRIRQEIESNCKLVPYSDCKISLASLGHDVGLIGAAQVWRHRFQQ